VRVTSSPSRASSRRNWASAYVSAARLLRHRWVLRRYPWPYPWPFAARGVSGRTCTASRYAGLTEPPCAAKHGMLPLCSSRSTAFGRGRRHRAASPPEARLSLQAATRRAPSALPGKTVRPARLITLLVKRTATGCASGVSSQMTEKARRSPPARSEHMPPSAAWAACRCAAAPGRWSSPCRPRGARAQSLSFPDLCWPAGPQRERVVSQCRASDAVAAPGVQCGSAPAT